MVTRRAPERRNLYGFRWKNSRRIDYPCDAPSIDVPLHVGPEPEPHDPSRSSNLMHSQPELAGNLVHLLIERLLDRALGPMRQRPSLVIGAYLECVLAELELRHDKHTKTKVVNHGEKTRVQLIPVADDSLSSVEYRDGAFELVPDGLICIFERPTVWSI